MTRGILEALLVVGLLAAACSSSGGSSGTSGTVAASSAAGSSSGAGPGTSSGAATSASSSNTGSGTGAGVQGSSTGSAEASTGTSSGGTTTGSATGGATGTTGGPGGATGTTGGPGGACACADGPGIACCESAVCASLLTMSDAGFNGTAEITQLTLGAKANCLAVAGGEVYWTDARGGVMRVPVGGGAPEVVTPCLGESPQGIAVDSSNVYFTIPDSGYVMRVDFDGGAPLAIATTEPSPFQIAVGSGIAYWTWSYETFSPFGGVHWVDADGGLASGPGNDFGRQNYYMFDIAAGPTEVGWTSAYILMDGPGNVVETLGLDGGPSSGVTSTITDVTLWPVGIALDSDFAYWTRPAYQQLTCGSGYVMSMALDGGGVTTLASGDLVDNPGAVVTAGSSLYWIEHGSEAFASDGGQCVAPGLWRLALDGGSPELIAQTGSDRASFQQGGATVLGSDACIAADDTSIYWVFDGQILKAAR